MLDRIKEKVFSGQRLTKKDALSLFKTDDIFTLGELASYIAKKKNGNKAYYIANRHINPTNICINRCRFCAFSRSKGQHGAYELTIEEIIKKLSSRTTPLREVHIVGGLHPDWPFVHYLKMISSIKKAFPNIHIKAFTAVEVDHMRRISGLSLSDVLKTLKRHGLDTMPGGGAEIFAAGIRKELCPEKLTGGRWLEVMETAHRLGIKTNATMLYGHLEDYGHRVEHLMSLRELQDRTGGFQAFIPLSYHPENTNIKGSYSSGLDDLKTIAVSRLVLDNFPHIKAYWVMLGEKISQLALLFGADDIDGTIVEEKITHMAGGKTKQGLTREELSFLIRGAGKTPVERDSFYRKVKK
jgi:aminodeoxyfutalosine synthase